MSDLGLVSVVMPSHNCAQFIGFSIESVVAQTYQNWELIIVDDNSSDDTALIVREYDDPRIRYYRNGSNQGAALSRNRALREAKGRWIAFLDSDDLWEPEKLERQISFMVGGGHGFSYHKYIETDENGIPNGKLVGGKKRVGKFDMFSCCWPGCLSVMYDARKIGLVQINDVRKDNDTAIWLKVVRMDDCYLLDENLARYRHRSGSITPSGLVQKTYWHYRLFRDAEGMNPVAAFFWMCMNVIGNSYKKIFYVKRIKC